MLSAKFRTSRDDNGFQNIFEIRPGTNYDRENFQVLTIFIIFLYYQHVSGTRLVRDPADIVSRTTLVRLGLVFGEIMLGCVSSDEVGLYF